MSSPDLPVGKIEWPHPSMHKVHGYPVIYEANLAKTKKQVHELETRVAELTAVLEAVRRFFDDTMQPVSPYALLFDDDEVTLYHRIYDVLGG